MMVDRDPRDNVDYAADLDDDPKGRLIVITAGDTLASITLGFGRPGDGGDKMRIGWLDVAKAHELGVCLIAGTQSGPCTWLEWTSTDYEGHIISLDVSDGTAELFVGHDETEAIDGTGLSYILNSQQAIGIATQLIAWARANQWDWLPCLGSGSRTYSVEDEEQDTMYVAECDGARWNTCPSCEAIVKLVGGGPLASEHFRGVDQAGAPAMQRGYIR
jgi:hypothetical protein